MRFKPNPHITLFCLRQSHYANFSLVLQTPAIKVIFSFNTLIYGDIMDARAASALWGIAGLVTTGIIVRIRHNSLVDLPWGAMTSKRRPRNSPAQMPTA